MLGLFILLSNLVIYAASFTLSLDGTWILEGVDARGEPLLLDAQGCLSPLLSFLFSHPNDPTLTTPSPSLSPVPGYIQEALVKHGHLSDTLYRGVESSPWIHSTVWTLRRDFHLDNASFPLSATMMDGTTPGTWSIELHHVATIAHLSLNNVPLSLPCTNFHIPCRLPLPSLLPGWNQLVIRIDSTSSYALDAFDAASHAIPSMQAPGMLPHYNFVRTPSFHFGWDWGPAVLPVGVGGGVTIRYSEPFKANVENVFVSTSLYRCTEGLEEEEEGMDHQEDQSSFSVSSLSRHHHHAPSPSPPTPPLEPPKIWNKGLRACRRLFFMVEPTIELHCPTTPCRGRVIIDSPVLLAPTTLPFDSGREKVVVLTSRLQTARMHAADLWWPWEMGGQTMHNFTFTIMNDDDDRDEDQGAIVVERRIGFRTIELVREPWSNYQVTRSTLHASHQNDKDDVEEGETFFFRVNGIPLFSRGANVVPSSLYSSSSSSSSSSLSLVNDARAANMNLLRIWGGGTYASSLLLQRADELGLLVWQEAPFACAPYPTDPFFLSIVSSELIIALKRIASHPSLVLFSGNNEVDQSLAWYNETMSHQATFREEYATLFLTTLPTLVASIAPHLIYIDSSPSSGLVNGTKRSWGDEANDLRYGDVHLYRYDADCELEASFPLLTNFVSEFGFMSLPSNDEFVATLDGEDALGEMKRRMRHPRGLDEVQEQMARHFRLAPLSSKSISHWSFLSQIQQLRCYQTAIELWRTRKLQPETPFIEPRIGPSGVLFWQMNDVWAGPSWSAIESSGRRKLLYHQLIMSFEPVLLSTIIVDPQFTTTPMRRSWLDTVMHLMRDWITLSPPSSQPPPPPQPPVSQRSLELRIVNDLPWHVTGTVSTVELIHLTSSSPSLLPGFVPISYSAVPFIAETLVSVKLPSVNDWYALRTVTTLSVECGASAMDPDRSEEEVEACQGLGLANETLVRWSFPSSWRDADLMNPGLVMDVMPRRLDRLRNGMDGGCWLITISASHGPAFYVTAFSSIVGTFDESAFHLGAAGESKTLQFCSGEPASLKEIKSSLSILSLYDVMPAIR